MKILSMVAVIMAVLILTALPAAADSLGSGAPTPEPTTEPGGSEEPSEEPTTEPGGEEQPPVQQRDELASTGIDTPTMALVGGGLLLAGGAALAVTRSGRRKDA